MKATGTPVERLVERMRDAGANIPPGYEFHRTHAGRVMRQNGAWSWFIASPSLGPSTRNEIGSQYSVTQLLKARRLVCSRYFAGHGMDVDPDEHEITPMNKHGVIWAEPLRTDS